MTSKTPMNFEEKVNKIVSQVKKGVDGKYEFPEGLDKALDYSVKAETRRREAQSEYTRSQQQVKELEAENMKLAESWKTDFLGKKTQLTDELLELKETNPDEYINKMSELKESASDSFKQKKEEIHKEARATSELERRQIILNEYNREHPEHPITDDIVQNELPPKLLKDLEKGSIDFNTFLVKASKILSSDKILGNNKKEDSPKFNNHGSSQVSNDDVNEQAKNDYSTFIF